MAEVSAHEYRDKLLTQIHNFAGDSTAETFDLEEIVANSASPRQS